MAITNQIKYEIFSYIQEYDKFATNFQNFEILEEIGNYFLIKYQHTDSSLNEPVKLDYKCCKVKKNALHLWLKKQEEQRIIDNGIEYIQENN